MTLEEWDRQLCGMTREEYAREKRRRALHKGLGVAVEVLGALALFALLGVFAWLCMAASGYHWE